MVGLKVCGMNNATNVKDISLLNPDYMGFIFYPLSQRYVGKEPDHNLFRNVPMSIIKTGVFVNEGIENLTEAAAAAGLEMIQLHGNESPDYCAKIRATGLRTIKAFQISDSFNMDHIKPYNSACDYFLFDNRSAKFGGSGKKFNWDKLLMYNLDKPFFLSGGIGPDDTSLIKKLRNRNLYAVDINSRFEISAGIKDVEMVRSFINEIKDI